MLLACELQRKAYEVLDCRAKESLLAATAKARLTKPEDTEAEKLLKEEQDILQHITQKTALKSVKELAKVNSSCIVFGSPQASVTSALVLSQGPALLGLGSE